MSTLIREARAMVVTDLDGTLFDSTGQLSVTNCETLVALGERDVLRVVATGRNLFSALQALPEDMPLDYLVFASGAGTMEWRSRELLDARHLDDLQALGAAARFQELGLDFMLHQGVPDNHRFWYHRSRGDNADFERRIARYDAHCESWPLDGSPTGPFSQLLAVGGSGLVTDPRRAARVAGAFERDPCHLASGPCFILVGGFSRRGVQGRGRAVPLTASRRRCQSGPCHRQRLQR